jgi:hypothetical protein
MREPVDSDPANRASQIPTAAYQNTATKIYSS